MTDRSKALPLGSFRAGALHRILLLLACVAALAALSCASAQPDPTDAYAVGSKLDAVTLEDQHGTERSIDTTVRLIVFSQDMDGAKMIREVLTAEPELLDQTRGVYVADISGMPTLIANMMALPSMRRRPYTMLLDRDGSATAAYPAAKGMATVMRLDALEVLYVLQLSSAQALRATLVNTAGSAGD